MQDAWYEKLNRELPLYERDMPADKDTNYNELLLPILKWPLIKVH
jgi:hypothetical protein